MEVGVKRIEQISGRGDPITKSRAGEVDAVTQVNVMLTIERQVIGIFADDHLGKQAGSGQTFVDDFFSRGSRHQGLFAGATGIDTADMFEDFERGRDVFELFRDLFANFGQFMAAGGAAGAFGEGFDPFDRQILRKGFPTAGTFRFRDPCRFEDFFFDDFELRPCEAEIEESFENQFHLVFIELFRARSEKFIEVIFDLLKGTLVFSFERKLGTLE